MLSANGTELAATDSKHDTTLDCRVLFSTFRVPVRWNQFGGVSWYGVVFGLSHGDSEASIERQLAAIRRNVPCSVAGCTHPTTAKWSVNDAGRKCYQRTCPCAPVFQPIVAVDKHLPSLNAIASAGLGGAVIDGMHGYNAFNRYLANIVEIGGSAANELMWAFRLWTRSQSDLHACKVAFTTRHSPPTALYPPRILATAATCRVEQDGAR